MPLTLDQYRRAHDALPGHLPADIVDQVVALFECYVRNAHKAGVTLDSVFNEAVRRGRESWHATIRRDRRDRAIAAWAMQKMPGVSSPKQADAWRIKIGSYRERWKRKDQHLAVNPYVEQWPSDFLLFESFWYGDGDVPDSPSQIERIIDAAKEDAAMKTRRYQGKPTAERNAAVMAAVAAALKALPELLRCMAAIEKHPNGEKGDRYDYNLLIGPDAEAIAGLHIGGNGFYSRCDCRTA
jgi:hypothetical protein